MQTPARHFMLDATMEEIWFVTEVFDFWDSGSLSGHVPGVKDVRLGEAFYEALGRNATYVHVRPEHRAQLQKFAEALAVIEDAA